MYTLFAKLLCATALASTALAQSVSIIQPQPGTAFTAGQQIIVELKESATPSSQTRVEVALVIAASSGVFDGTDLGTIDFLGVFAAQSTDSEGNKYANYSITAPDWFDGPGSLNLAHYFLLKPYGTSKLEYASVGFTVSGSSG